MPQIFGDDGVHDGTEESDSYIVIFGDRNTINGAGGNDIIAGTNGANTEMNGGAGNDRLVGNQDDIFNGGANNDQIDLNLQGVSDDIVADLEAIHNAIGVQVGGATVVDVERGLIALGTGNDTVTASSGAGIFLYGYDGNDRLIGDTGADSLGGGHGVDVLDGMGGDDLLFAFAPENFNAWESSASLGSPDDAGARNYLNGGDGADVMVASAADDFFDGGADVDTVSYDPDIDVAVGVKIDLRHVLQKTGASGFDRIVNVENVTGSGAADLLRGDDGANALDGGVGSDVLFGGLGADTLTGSDGADRFQYKALADLDGDRIIDLDTGDTLDLRAIDADATKGGNQKFKVVTDAFHGKAGELLLVRDGLNPQTIAQADVDGDGVADATFILNGAHDTNQDGFVL